MRDVIDNGAKPEGELNALARIHLARIPLAIADPMRRIKAEHGIT